MNKVYSINTAIAVCVLIGSVVFDASLTLGKFHGLFFSLLLAYAAAGFFIINGILAIITYIKHKKSREYIISAIMYPLVLVGITQIVAFVINQ